MNIQPISRENQLIEDTPSVQQCALSHIAFKVTCAIVAAVAAIGCLFIIPVAVGITFSILCLGAGSVLFFADKIFVSNSYSQAPIQRQRVQVVHENLFVDQGRVRWPSRLPNASSSMPPRIVGTISHRPLPPPPSLRPLSRRPDTPREVSQLHLPRRSGVAEPLPPPPQIHGSARFQERERASTRRVPPPPGTGLIIGAPRRGEIRATVGKRQ